MTEDIEDNSCVKMICDGVQNKDLFMPIKNFLDAREDTDQNDVKKNSTPSQRSIYREMMFVTLKSFGQDNIDLTAFVKLPAKYHTLITPSDRPPNAVTVLCRKFFR